MPKKQQSLTPLLNCSRCSFSTKNRYIFTRHNNRCSKSDIPGLSKDYPSSVAALAKTKLTTEDGDTTVTDTSYIDESMNVGEEIDNVNVEGGQNTIEDEPEPGTAAAHDENANEEVEDNDLLEETSDPLDNNDLPKKKGSKMPRIMIKMKSGRHRGQPHRNYSCDDCNFQTTKSKVYLYHLLERHNGSFSIFPCTFCDYACRWKHKLLRHMKMVHKNRILPQSDDIEAEILKTGKSKAEETSETDFLVAPKVTIQKSKTGVLKVKKKPTSVKIKVTEKTTASEYIVDLTKTESSPHFKCKLCAYSSRMKARVHNHVMACHINAKEFHCKYCSFTTTKKTDYYAHNANHENQKVWSCEDCAYTTSFKPNYLRHRINHNRNFRFKCSICSYTSDHEGALKRHVMYSHSLSLQNLAGSHMEQNTEPNISASVTPTPIPQSSPVKDTSDDDAEDNEMFPLLPGFKRCEFCGFLGMSDEEVDEHIALHNQNAYFPCQICKLKYKRAGDLNRHMKLKHNLRLKDFIRRQGTGHQVEISLTGEITVPSITGAKARVVNKENISYNAADGSYGISQDDEDEEIQFRSKGDDQPLDLSMPSPDKSPSKGNFDPENLQCPDCVYIAKWPSDLRRHSVVHTIEKRFKCKYCDKKYKYSGDLNVHVRRDHSDEQHFIAKVQKTFPSPKRKGGVLKCPSCTYTSPFKSEMERHSRTHTDEKPHSCILCDYESHWKGDVKRHIQKHHPEVMSSTVPVEDFIGTSLDGENVPAPDDNQYIQPASSMIFPEKEALPTTPPKQTEKKKDNSPHKDASATDDLKEPIFKCKYCEFTASAPSKLKAHVITHVNLKQWKCPVCPRRSNWKWDIRKHILKDHPDCSVTNVIMLTEEEAKATIQDYISKSTMPKRENHLDNMNIAEAQDELKFPYRCSLCDFVSAYRWEVSKHLRIIHPGDICSVIVAFSSGSTEDENAQIGLEPVKELSPKMDIRKMLKQPPLRTKISDLLAKTPKNDQSDNSRKRTRSKKGDENFKSRLFMCGECGKRCSSHGDVKKHYKYIHPDKELRVIYLGNTMTSTPNPQATSPSLSPALSKSPVKGIKKGCLESKYNNPKAMGYIKPFQCSVCLRRSNWKWDINKHMRETHQGVPYHLIVLPEEEARSSLATYIPPMQQQAYQRAKLAQINADALQLTASPSPSRQQVIRNLKQFMCSLCHYRSDWRSDTHRHIKNKHGRNRATIILMDPAQAKATLETYMYKRSGAEKRVLFPKPADPLNPSLTVKSSLSRRSSVESGSSSTSKTNDQKGLKPANNTLKGKLWKCSKCPYSNKERKLVSIHLKTHRIKPYNCKFCGHSSNYRSALYRHLRAKHNSNDFTMCDVPMKYQKGVQKDGLDDMETENLTMEEMEELEAGHSSHMDVDEDSKGEDKLFDEKVAFHCKLCKFQTTWRSCIRRHLRERHASTDFNLCVIKQLDPSMLKKKGRRKYPCALCPYQTEKPGLLKFHMANHTPQPGNRYKCKYCPYYVCAKRLLHQHLKIHAQTGRKVPVAREPKAATPKRYQCEKCPFKTGSKNDILYHKQFHRPRPSANFKCDYCEYWVTHRRLLKQHYRMHKQAEVAGESPIKTAPVPAPVMPSPCKSEMTDASWCYNPVDAASIKQQVISSKITRTLAVPGQSPMKPSSGPAGFVVKNGVFRKLHHCRYCPYMNMRGRNLRLHEKMHGWRLSDKALFKCTSCNYTVGSKGLLSHHMKVHMKGYGLDPNDTTTADLENLEGVHVEGDEHSDRSSEVSDQQHDNRMDALLEIARFKKFACEKCPYASAKRNHFERHLELHGSKQRCICDFCDYSVPSNNLLVQHQKLHLMPNQNLLAVQSISNLQHLPEITADVAVASFLSAYNPEKEKTINVTHDHMELYENNPEPPGELKKLYRCDRCPYANIRRDHLLAHLKFHMVRSELGCPYCDYSVNKSHLLHQHIKVHFSPLPEFSEWLEQNGSKERTDQDPSTTNGGNPSLASMEDQSTRKTTDGRVKDENTDSPIGNTDGHSPSNEKSIKKDGNDTAEDRNTESIKEDKLDSKTNVCPGPSGSEMNYVCQYCDREFSTSEQLVSHEMQHLIGNDFEASQPLELPSPVQEMNNLETMETPHAHTTDSVSQ